MSWDGYIDNLIAQSMDVSGSIHVDKACIIGLDSGSPWTTAGHTNALKLTPAEAATIANCFRKKDFDYFMTTGVQIEGRTFLFLRVEDNKIVMAKLGLHGFITAQATKTAIVIAQCPEGKQPGNLTKAVGVIADYLESMNM